MIQTLEIKNPELFMVRGLKPYIDKFCYISTLTESNTLLAPNPWFLNHLFDLLKCLCLRIVLIVTIY
jgi:hypothetical protein